MLFTTLGWQALDNVDAKTADLNHLDEAASRSLPLSSDLGRAVRRRLLSFT